MTKRFLDTLTSEERKQYPMSRGLIDYFPDFLALVSHVSFMANEKHNPGQPMHWSRGKSTDHADCVIRHHSTRDSEDFGVPLLHMAEEAWRVLAMGQEAMEKYYGLDLPRNARYDDPEAEGRQARTIEPASLKLGSPPMRWLQMPKPPCAPNPAHLAKLATQRYVGDDQPINQPEEMENVNRNQNRESDRRDSGADRSDQWRHAGCGIGDSGETGQENGQTGEGRGETR